MIVQTFEPLWVVVATWQCYFYVTDGWLVYLGFIPEGDQIVSKTYVTQDLHGQSERREHSFALLSRSTTSEEVVLFQTLRKAGTFHSIVTSLPQVPRGARSLVHRRLIQQCLEFFIMAIAKLASLAQQGGNFWPGLATLIL